MAKIGEAELVKALKEAKTAKEMIDSWTYLAAATTEEAKEQESWYEEYYKVWIDKAPHMVGRFMHDPYKDMCERQILDPKTRELVAVALLACLEEGEGLAWHMAVAMREGATEEEIMELCSKNLSSYKKPKSIEFVDSLPMSAQGKILKRELRAKYWAGRDRKI